MENALIAFGRAVLYLYFCFSFLRSQSAKTKNKELGSTMLPQAKNTLSGRPHKSRYL
jgi:hypothetical protein